RRHRAGPGCRAQKSRTPGIEMALHGPDHSCEQHAGHRENDEPDEHRRCLELVAGIVHQLADSVLRADQFRDENADDGLAYGQPLRMKGTEAGRATVRKICRSPAPKQRAARSNWESRLRTPLLVLIRTGKTATRKTSAILEVSPIPSQMIKRGDSATRGTEYM